MIERSPSETDTDFDRRRSVYDVNEAEIRLLHIAAREGWGRVILRRETATGIVFEFSRRRGRQCEIPYPQHMINLGAR